MLSNFILLSARVYLYPTHRCAQNSGRVFLDNSIKKPLVGNKPQGLQLSNPNPCTNQTIEGFSLTVTGRQPGVAHIVYSGCRLVLSLLAGVSQLQTKEIEIKFDSKVYYSSTCVHKFSQYNICGFCCQAGHTRATCEVLGSVMIQTLQLLTLVAFVDTLQHK